MDLASIIDDKAASSPAPKVVDGQPPVTDDKKADSSTENLPWHKDERFQSFMKEKKTLEAANAKLQKLLKENELEDPDDLEDLVKSGKTVRGKLADLNALDDIIGKAVKLDSYEAYWAQQAEKRRKEETDPETRARQAEEQLELERRRQASEQNANRQAAATKAAVKSYETDVLDLIKDVGLPKEQETFVAEMFGVNNPSNDVNIMDKKAIKKLVADGVKRYDALKQSIIADYLKGKTDIVRTGKGSESSVQDTAPKINLREARKIAGEQIANMFRGG